MGDPASGTFVPSIFQFDSQAVRIFVDEQGEPWFCAKDICAVLGYTNDSKAIKDHCRLKGVTKRYPLTKGGQQELTFINEGNLYRLIIKSHLPAAERFEAWVCDEVLARDLQNREVRSALASKRYSFSSQHSPAGH